MQLESDMEIEQKRNCFSITTFNKQFYTLELRKRSKTIVLNKI